MEKLTSNRLLAGKTDHAYSLVIVEAAVWKVFVVKIFIVVEWIPTILQEKIVRNRTG